MYEKKLTRHNRSTIIIKDIDVKVFLCKNAQYARLLGLRIILCKIVLYFFLLEYFLRGGLKTTTSWKMKASISSSWRAVSFDVKNVKVFLGTCSYGLKSYRYTDKQTGRMTDGQTDRQTYIKYYLGSKFQEH